MALNSYGNICLEQISGGVLQIHIKLHQPSERLWYMIAHCLVQRSKTL